LGGYPRAVRPSASSRRTRFGEEDAYPTRLPNLTREAVPRACATYSAGRPTIPTRLAPHGWSGSREPDRLSHFSIAHRSSFSGADDPGRSRPTTACFIAAPRDPWQRTSIRRHRPFDGLGQPTLVGRLFRRNRSPYLATLRSPERTRLLHVFRYRCLSASIPESTRPDVFAGQAATH
jgi:hypothetical protein